MWCRFSLGFLCFLSIHASLIAAEIGLGSLVVVIQDKATIRTADEAEVPVAIGEVFRVLEIQDHRLLVEPAECLPGDDLPPSLLAFRTRRLMPYYNKHSGSVDRKDLCLAEDALPSWNEAIRNTPTAEGYHRRAKLHLAIGDLQNARKDIDQAILLEPGHSGIHWTRYQLHLKAASHELAMADLNAILTRDPQNETAMASRAALFSLMENTTRAEEAFAETIRQHPQGVLVRLEKARFHEIQEDWEEASRLYQEITKLEPDDSTAFLLDTFPTYGIHGPVDAIDRCTEALLIEPGLLPALRMRGYFRRSIKDWEGMSSDYSEVIAKHPTEDVAYSERAFAYYRLQRNGEAIADYDQALKLNPESDRALYYRGRCYYRLGQYEQASEDFSKQIELDPLDPDAWHERAVTWIAWGQYDKAMNDLDRTIELNPKHAVALSNRAMIWLARENTDRALVEINAALRLNPVNAYSFNKRGEIYALRSENSRALSDFTTALKINPRFSDALMNRGRLYLTLKKYPKALADFDQMESLNPQSYLPPLNRAGMHFLLNERDLAISQLDEAIRRAPLQAEVYAMRAGFWKEYKEYDKQLDDLNRSIELGSQGAPVYVERGNLLRIRKQYDLAIADLQHAISIDPAYPHSYNNIAFVYQETMQYDKAIAALDTGLRLNPKFAWGWSSRGWTKRLKKDYDGAIADYDEAIRQAPVYVDALINRGACWQDKREYAKAMDDYESALKYESPPIASRRCRAVLHTVLGEFDWAHEDYNILIEVAPQSFEGWNGRAWLLATCPVESLRNGRQAVEDALKACELTQFKTAFIIDTLAAAYAEVGEYDKAVEWQMKAIDLCSPAEKQDLTEHLELYRKQKPYRLPDGVEVIPESSTSE